MRVVIELARFGVGFRRVVPERIVGLVEEERRVAGVLGIDVDLAGNDRLPQHRGAAELEFFGHGNPVGLQHLAHDVAEQSALGVDLGRDDDGRAGSRCREGQRHGGAEQVLERHDGTPGCTGAPTSRQPGSAPTPRAGQRTRYLAIPGPRPYGSEGAVRAAPRTAVGAPRRSRSAPAGRALACAMILRTGRASSPHGRVHETTVPLRCSPRRAEVAARGPRSPPSEPCHRVPTAFRRYP